MGLYCLVTDQDQPPHWVETLLCTTYNVQLVTISPLQRECSYRVVVTAAAATEEARDGDEQIWDHDRLCGHLQRWSADKSTLTFLEHTDDVHHYHHTLLVSPQCRYVRVIESTSNQLLECDHLRCVTNHDMPGILRPPPGTGPICDYTLLFHVSPTAALRQWVCRLHIWSR